MRYSYIDSARILLMVLGVFYHAAQMFQMEFDASVYFDIRDASFDIITFVIHSFRMPAFFLIAGFLGALVLSKCQPIEFLERRTNRLLLPFVIIAAFVNTWVVHRVSNEPMTGDLFPTLHLWFLPVLMICAVLHASVFRPDQLSRFLPKFRIADVLLAPAMLFGGAIVWFLSLHIFWHLPLVALQNLTNGLVAIPELGAFLPMYFGGALLYHYRSQLEKLLSQWPLYLIVTLTYFWLEIVHKSGYVTELFQYAASIGMTLLTLSFCRHFIPAQLSKPWMSNYSYTLYLLHQPILLTLRLPVMTHIPGIMTRYLVMCSATIAICSLLHLVIMRRPLLSYLLNGESKVFKEGLAVSR